MHGRIRATGSLFSRPRMHAWLVGSVSGLLAYTVSTVSNLVVRNLPLYCVNKNLIRESSKKVNLNTHEHY